MPTTLIWIMAAFLGQQPAASSAAPTLDFEFFKTRVQPIFLAKREGHARCYACHSQGTPMRLQALSPGNATWTEEESRRNFEAVLRMVVPGEPLKSQLLRHPLAMDAGGTLFHNGGKHWDSQNNPEWQTLAAWVRRQPSATPPAAAKLRIIQTNSAGENIHIIDPAANKVVGEVSGVEVSHGAAASPDGTRLYFSNEADHTLDVVDVKTLKVIGKVRLSGRPNNIAISKDGRRVYVAIAVAPGAVDVIDTTALQNAKSVPIRGAVHNTYVTPDGRYAIAGSIQGRTLTAIDTRTDEVAWVHEFDLGVRPLAFSQNPDGSTKWVFAQLSNFNGFAVLDFESRKELTRVKHPDLAPGKTAVTVGGNVSHGIAVTPDSRTLIVNSRLNSAVYKYSLPDLKLQASIDIDGIDPNWITLTPDGRRAYVAIAGSNFVSAIDIASMKQVARIPVGQVPKRNITAMLQ